MTLAPRTSPGRTTTRAQRLAARGNPLLRNLEARGDGMVWLTGGATALGLAMILGLLALVCWQGAATFWPGDVVRLATHDGRVVVGEVTRDEWYPLDASATATLPAALRGPAAAAAKAGDGRVRRRLVRTGNFDWTGVHFEWVPDFAVAGETRPEWALVVERTAWGRFYGEPVAFEVDGRREATTPDAAWASFRARHGECRARVHRRRDIETGDIGALNHRIEAARLAVRGAELDARRAGRAPAEAPGIAAATAALVRTESDVQAAMARLRAQIDALAAENARYRLVCRIADGREAAVPLADVVRAYPANQQGWFGRAGTYGGRWWEYLTDEPREANSEGGVWPAIFGTVTMTLCMSVVVVPFGVLAALYLREYARAGFAVSAVRIAVNNLAGVPSIVFGVFGLGFFCYIVGAGIDELLFEARLPNPTFGKGGLLWAAATLALLTLPVVIVATEEALAAVPNSMREGSYACGASKWQTIRRIVLPRALPGIMTGMILAMARGAGEVAPLMLVGAVKLAPDLPLDGTWPFLHPERSFMHLGFHIYDLGFQSQNSEAAKPMVYTTTLLLVAIVATLNVAAVWLRSRLRRKFVSSHV